MHGPPELPAAFELRYMDTVDDLRARCVTLAREGAGEGVILWAANPQSARGRLGQPWLGGEGNFHCGVILEPEFERGEYGEVAVVAVVALGNALATHLGPMISLGYTWPNDLNIAGHKVGAVWLDADPDDGNPWLCVSCSVNIMQAPDDFSIPAMSVAEAEGITELDARTLLETFARQFITQINNWSERGMPGMTAQWKIRAEALEDETTVHLGQHSVSGRGRGVTERCARVLETADGVREITLNQAFGL